jgi:hypothetical protein
MMSNLAKLFHQGKYDELWQRCCSFIDLSPGDFMRIQRRLLSEQIELLKDCELGRVIMNGVVPHNLEEFRKQIPLTTYADYAPYLLEQREDVLPRKPVLWQYTSGKSGEYTFRWVPVTAEQLEQIEPLIFALVFFSSCDQRKMFTIRGHNNVLYGMAPPPYATGTMARAFPHEQFHFLPPVDAAEKMTFEERIKMGFEMALSDGLDICFALSSVAVAIGERFSQRGEKTDISKLIKSPGALLRLGIGIIKSKLAGRQLLPRDIWSLKGLITFGIDGSIYREKIKKMWGRYPLDFHGCTEAVIIAMQTWDYQGMTFVPNLQLYEFIREEDSIRSLTDPAFQPPTYLMDEITPGNYELVITSFHGGPFIRYRLGHLVKITALKNERLDINIPQMSFLSRIDDQIDIAGFTRLSEKIVWQAIENSGINYTDWVARKEVKRDKPVLHLYIEFEKDEPGTALSASSIIHEELKKLDEPYADLENFTGLKPLEVTVLPGGTFAAYKERQKEAGADITKLNPPHINISDETLAMLLACMDGTSMKVGSAAESDG